MSESRPETSEAQAEKSGLIKVLNYAMICTATFAVLLQMVSARYLFQTFNEMKVMHICMGLVVLSMLTMKQALVENRRPHLAVALWSLFILMSLGILVYLKATYFTLIQKGDPETLDMVVGILLILLCMEFTRRFFGKNLVILALIFIAYTFLGQFLPEPFHAGPFEFPYIISFYSVGFRGSLGFILGVSVKYIFLFVVFGSLLLATGAHRFLFLVALTLSRRVRSGPVLAAVVPSMFMGTVTGVASANIFITGSFSIPLMKRVGFKPHQAGAYEVAASAAGQIMPPIMGAAAFIMADFTESAYLKIIILALIPAILFYFSVAVYGHLTSLKMDIRVTKEDIEGVAVKGTISTAPVFFVPLVIIVVTLALGFTASTAIFWGICSLFAVSPLIKATRLSPKGYLQAVTDGAVLGFKISVLLSIIGIIVSTVIMTGLGVKLSYFASSVMGHNLFGMLFIVMVASIILGTGVPTSAAYVLVSFISVPILIDAGVGLYAAHFFALYFAGLSIVTPPVAPAAALGAALAGGSFWRTALESSKVSLAGFLVPYLFVLFPPLLLDFSQTTRSQLVLGFLTCLLVILNLEVLFVGYYSTHCNLVERALALIACLLFIGYLTNHSLALFGGGVIVFLGLTGLQWKRSRAKKPLAAAH